MNQKEPLDILTWKKDDPYVTINRTLHEIICIDKNTGKQINSIKQVTEIPPITRRRKHKRKQK